MSNQGDIFVNALARRLVGAGRRERLSLTGTSGPTGTDEETAVDTLPDFDTGSIGDVLTLVDDGGDTVASWQPGSGGGSGLHYRIPLIEVDGAGGFTFIVDETGAPLYSLMELE